MKPLSSDYLYHFTHSLSAVKGILNAGFRFCVLKESLPAADAFITQLMFGVCFCDIRKEDSFQHRNCYGHYSIVLKKEWGKRNGVSPVRYVHSNSPGIFGKYRKLVNQYTRFLEAHRKQPTIDFEVSLLLITILSQEKKIIENDLIDEFNFNPNLLNEFKSVEDEFNDFFDFLNNEKHKVHLETFSKYFYALNSKIRELHNELFQRDFFMRSYAADTFCKRTGKEEKNKVLYDEKEWRAIKIKELGKNIDQRMIAIKNAEKIGHLPDEDNLMFNHDDLVAIIVNREDEKKELIDSVHQFRILEGFKTFSKFVFTYEEFEEE
jgi:hypothetical protein